MLDALELQVDSLNESRVSDSKEEGGNNNIAQDQGRDGDEGTLI